MAKNFKVLKEITLSKNFRDIPNSEEGKLSVINNWDEIKGWFNQNRNKFFVARNDKGEIFSFPSNEVLNDIKGIMKSDATAIITIGDPYTLVDKNKKWVNLDLSMDVWAEAPRGIDVFFEQFWKAADLSGKFFGDNLTIKPTGLNFGKKYLGDAVVKFKLTPNYLYSYQFIKDEIDKGTLKWTDVEVADAIDFSDDPKKVKDWYDKIKGVWFENFDNVDKYLNTKYGDFNDEDLKKVRDDIKKLGEWTTIFPSPLTPKQVRDEYDKPKEKHTDADLKPADYDQIKKDLATAQADLKTKTDELKTTTDKITELEKIKGDYELLKAKAEGLNNGFETLKAEKATAQEAQKKAETDLKTWTDTFGDKKPSEVKTEYDKLKEQHTADQSEKPKPEALKLSEYDKILLLLQKHQKIQQLKEQLKDKVLLATSKTELLEKWDNYEYFMLIFQASAGEFALLWTNSEMRKSMVYYFMNDDERKETAKKEIEPFLEPTTLMVNHVDLWHASNPDKNPTYTGFLAIGAAEKLLLLIKKNSRLNLGNEGKDQGQFSNYFYDLGLPIDWYVQERTKLQNDLQKVYDNLAIDEEIIKQKKGPFLTYLHTRPVFSSLYKEIKKLNSNVDLLHVTDDKNEFLKNLSEHRFNLLLWEWKDGCWSVLWTQYRDKFDYYTDTDEELEFRQEEAQIKKFLKGERSRENSTGESSTHLFSHWGPGNSEEGKTKQGFATVNIEAILKRIKDNPKLVLSEKIRENDLNLLEGIANVAQKEYDIYLKQLNQKDQKIEQISQIEVKPKS